MMSKPPIASKTRRSAKARIAGPAPSRRRRPRAAAAAKRAVPAKAARSRPGGGDLIREVLARLRRSGGCGAVVLVAECAEGRCDVTQRIEIVAAGPRRPGSAARPRVRLARAAGAASPALAAAGHAQRLAILALLVEGPATYRALQRLTKLKAGPLYHHVHQLRMAGLILPKQRDLYELTRGGRNLMMVVVAVAPLVRDARRRPV